MFLKWFLTKINCFKGGPSNKYSNDINASREPLVNDTGKAYIYMYTLVGSRKA